MKLELNISPLENWIPGIKRPLICAGPCSAETERQVLDTAKAIANIPQVRIFRSGLWKPRTRPGDFEGIGEKGLPWLQQVRQDTGLLTCVEVASPWHVEACLKHDIDILWLGARTVVNPFSVKEISASLKEVDIPVMVKNPMNPDLNLWIGAVERLQHAGIHKIIAIHRGFSAYKVAPYRNIPLWEIPIELKRLAPQLPIIVDPSHIGGHRDLISQLSQIAMDLTFDGLMIETHINPGEAWSDKNQQITPEALRLLIERLSVPTQTLNGKTESALGLMREQIDGFDDLLIETLSQRMRVIKDIGKVKKEKNISAFQIERWNEILNKRLELSEKYGLNTGFIKKILELIHKEALRIQTEGGDQSDSVTGKE